jgi:hypothetical protein
MRVGDLIEDDHRSFAGYLVEPGLGQGGRLQQNPLMHGIGAQPPVQVLGVYEDWAQRNVLSLKAVQGVARAP